jgi:hypothetical protein
MLGAISNNWNGDKENWEPAVHGGPKGKTFWDQTMELIPETIVIEAEPTGFPRAPVSKKRVWIDTRNMMFVAYVTYDRRGELWKSFEPSFSQYVQGDQVVMDGAHPLWTWTHVLSHDIQTNRMSRFYQAKEVRGGFYSGFNQPDLYDRYMTEQAIRRLGS